MKACSTWAEVLHRPEKTYPVYETDLGVHTQIVEFPKLPEYPSAGRISEYVCDMKDLFSTMNVGSYGPTEPHLWLVGKIPCVRGRIAGLLLRRSGLHIRTMTLWTCSFSLL